MIESFGNKTASDLFHEYKSKRLPRELWKRTTYLLDIIDAVESLEDLKSEGFPPSLRLHSLKGDCKGEYAIDIHKLKGWRITFRFIKVTPHPSPFEIKKVPSTFLEKGVGYLNECVSPEKMKTTKSQNFT